MPRRRAILSLHPVLYLVITLMPYLETPETESGEEKKDYLMDVFSLGREYWLSWQRGPRLGEICAPLGEN